MVPEICSATDSFLLFWAIFSHLTLLTMQKIKILKKRKKHVEILLFYTCVPQMTIIWYMLPEILSTTDKIFLSVWAILCPTKNWKINILKQWNKQLEISSFYTCVPPMIIIWCMVPEIWSATEFFFILDHLLPFYLPNNPKNQNFEMKCYTAPEIWCVTDVSFIFNLPFYPSNSTKNQNFTWRCHHFIYVYQKLWPDDVQLLRCGTQETDR